MKTFRTRICISALPGIVMFALYLSLMMHMYQSLGGWPTSIGTRGFPTLLASHAALTENFLTLWGLLSVFAIPSAIAVCLFVARWRAILPYLAVNELLFIVWLMSMQFAPKGFSVLVDGLTRSLARYPTQKAQRGPHKTRH